MDKQTTPQGFRNKWLRVALILSFANTLASAFVFLASIGLPGASIFDGPTFAAVLFTGSVSMQWFFMLKHKTTGQANQLYWQLVLATLTLFASAVFQIYELRTCFFTPYDNFDRLATCTDVFSSSNAAPTSSVCQGQAFTDQLIDGCAAARVSSSNIEGARWLGSITSAVVLGMVLISCFMLAIKSLFLEEDFINDERVENQCRAFNIVFAASKLGIIDQLVAAITAIDKGDEDFVNQFKQTGDIVSQLPSEPYSSISKQGGGVSFSSSLKSRA